MLTVFLKSMFLRKTYLKDRNNLLDYHHNKNIYVDLYGHKKSSERDCRMKEITAEQKEAAARFMALVGFDFDEKKKCFTKPRSVIISLDAVVSCMEQTDPNKTGREWLKKL